MISVTLLFFLFGLNKLMCGFLFNARNTIYKLLSYTKIHAIFINLRTLLFLILVFNADLSMGTVLFLVDLMTAISIFFAYAQLAYGFSIKDCMFYLVCGKIDKEWLKEIQK
ncbi:hypothetical protein A0M76_09445 [Campylobacter coli]|uniref:hypothetical protein n=1 Tax=Campylobacter coli TaxID=195 RepID=UPI0008757545|nr:hypothetical protein [Campylobacter coli]OEV72353.1 hypothetical protein AJ469_05010 [Campylobacter coli]OEV74421.1 hypothetical protein AJ871_08395 [Campylobacter coli]OEV74594.1 hypothetical protein AJO32_06490 [Campylobacter coli]OEX28628.1 hypothetical protein A0M76_09445 [Campylobacter coli]HAA1512981.1 hypothetical protein [Campylobacter coli]